MPAYSRLSSYFTSYKPKAGHVSAVGNDYVRCWNAQVLLHDFSDMIQTVP